MLRHHAKSSPFIVKNAVEQAARAGPFVSEQREATAVGRGTGAAASERASAWMQDITARSAAPLFPGGQGEARQVTSWLANSMSFIAPALSSVISAPQLCRVVAFGMSKRRVHGRCVQSTACCVERTSMLTLTTAQERPDAARRKTPVL